MTAVADMHDQLRRTRNVFEAATFVGCGGSGGVTLQYVMDNLRTTLLRAAEAVGGRWPHLRIASAGASHVVAVRPCRRPKFP